jgi:uncharacterized membrane protein
VTLKAILKTIEAILQSFGFTTNGLDLRIFRFMEGVKHCSCSRISTPLGNRIRGRKEWDAIITDLTPDQRIAWESEEGDYIAGIVTFEPVEASITRG